MSTSSASSQHHNPHGHPPARDASASPHYSQGSTTAGAMANNPHIAMLLEAEREAAAIVTRARQYRVEKLKSARTEAMAEIENLRKQKQREFEEYERSFKETMAQMDKEQEEKTQKQIQHVRESVEAHKEEFIQMILKKALEKNPDVI